MEDKLGIIFICKVDLIPFSDLCTYQFPGFAALPGTPFPRLKVKLVNYLFVTQIRNVIMRFRSRLESGNSSRCPAFLSQTDTLARAASSMLMALRADAAKLRNWILKLEPGGMTISRNLQIVL